ncbi:hypothetical protein C8R43DRAFT_1130694 [Mycena crocata]|nr:hypothetical protein C8R43DRAFT_1130690 [Mycena crocata]KAJ7143626.1 hypothetical protein C8R43DRAFT_1130694 [Mycena crocata]
MLVGLHLVLIPFLTRSDAFIFRLNPPEASAFISKCNPPFLSLFSLSWRTPSHLGLGADIEYTNVSVSCERAGSNERKTANTAQSFDVMRRFPDTHPSPHAENSAQSTQALGSHDAMKTYASKYGFGGITRPRTNGGPDLPPDGLDLPLRAFPANTVHRAKSAPTWTCPLQSARPRNGPPKRRAELTLHSARDADPTRVYGSTVTSRWHGFRVTPPSRPSEPTVCVPAACAPVD